MGQTFSSNQAYLMNSISINSATSCTGRVLQKQEANRFIAKSVDCGGDFNFGGQVAQQVVNCRNDQQVAATARAAASQAATSSVSGLFAFGSSNANNIVQMQQTIAENIQGRCDATIQQTIQDETYSSGPIIAKGSCNVYTQSADQRFTCTNTIIASASESESAQQTASSTVAGFDPTALLVILVFVFVLVFGGGLGAIFKGVKGAGKGVLGMAKGVTSGVTGSLEGVEMTAVKALTGKSV